MARPSKLTPDQWLEIERRHLQGEGVSALAREFGISPASVSVRVSKDSKMILETAHKLADGQDSLAALPTVTHQYRALSIAEKMRNASSSLASAAELGAKTAHRLHALANAEVNKVDDTAPLENVDALKGVSVLTKLANDSSALALGMMTKNAAPIADLSDDEDGNTDLSKLTDEELAKLEEMMGKVNATA